MQKSNRRIKVFQGWDTSLKIPALFLLMMVMSFIREGRLMLLLPCIAIILFAASGIRLSLLLSKLRAPLIFLLSISSFLILFSSGEAFYTIGFIALKSTGISLAINTCLRVLSIITIGIVMVETTPLAGISGKLKQMKIPKILVDIGILTGRYIMVTGEDFSKMKNSRKLRGYLPKKSIASRLKIIVPTSATLLIRGFQQSEMVFNAMHMRGYGADTDENKTIEKPSLPSMVMFVTTLLVCLTLIVLEISIEAR